jgi:hypothetical protein
MTKMLLSSNEAGLRLPSAGDGLAGAFWETGEEYIRGPLSSWQKISPISKWQSFAIYWRDMARSEIARRIYGLCV